MDILEFPEEILFKIFEYIEPQQLLKARICSLFSKICCDASLWKKFCSSHWQCKTYKQYIGWAKMLKEEYRNGKKQIPLFPLSLMVMGYDRENYDWMKENFPKQIFGMDVRIAFRIGDVPMFPLALVFFSDVNSLENSDLIKVHIPLKFEVVDNEKKLKKLGIPVVVEKKDCIPKIIDGIKSHLFSTNVLEAPEFIPDSFLKCFVL